MEHHFSNMPVQVPENTPLGYLGFRQNSIPPSEHMKAEIRKNISSIRPSGIVKMVDVTFIEDTVVLGEGGRVISRGFFNYLYGCSKALLMVSTVGPVIPERIGNMLKSGEAEDGVILDACASACADAGLDFMLKMRKPYLYKMGFELLPTRFSPGYGDMPLSFQRVLYTQLDAGRLGIELTEGNMLKPEKSVLAVCGVKAR